MSKLYLGIDTSNYKTSISIIDESGQIIWNKSEYLDVPQGKRGLRQSEAFFMHSNRLPSYINEMSQSIDPRDINAIGVSSRPRRLEGSYMPCFLAGCNLAEEIASILRIPLFRFSHQEGHAAAIIENLPGKDYSQAALLFHLSGGTTEFLIAEPDLDGYKLEIVGGSLDISVGQLIDRVGVAMGLDFPAGYSMDKLALASIDSKIITNTIMPTITLKDGYFNLSGAETKVLRCIEAHLHCANEGPSNIMSELDAAQISLNVLDSLAVILQQSITYLTSKYDIKTVFMAGGVSSSSYIRSKLLDEPGALSNSNSSNRFEIIFGRPELSSDNAIGIALLARRKANNI